MTKKEIVIIVISLLAIISCAGFFVWQMPQKQQAPLSQNNANNTSPAKQPIQNKTQKQETKDVDCSKIPQDQLSVVSASGIQAKIVAGTRLCPDESQPYLGCQRTLKLVLANKTEKTIFSSVNKNKKGACWDGAIWHPASLAISPNGQYLFYKTFAWEISKANLYDIGQNLELINEGEPNLYFASQPVWSINNEYGALATNHSTFGGEGITAIYVITNGSPRIKQVWDFPSSKISFTSPGDGDALNARIKDLRFTDPETIYFEVVSEPQAGDYKTYKYSYNIRTNKLAQQ